MSPRVSLLDELRKGGYEASLIATFNAYLPFYEEVVLRRLVNAGVRHNVLLMDARQYSVSLQSHPPRLAGRDYTLASVAVPGAFHPKLIFLVGKQKGLLIVGSHNVTIAGFGFNRELTNVLHIRSARGETGTEFAGQLWSEIVQWISSSSQTIPQQIHEMVVRIREFAPWISTQSSDTDSEVRLLSGRAGAPSLWEQLRSLVNVPAKEAFLTGAFFDTELAFLSQVQYDLRPEQTVVAVDPNTVVMPPAPNSLSGVHFVRATNLGTDNQQDFAPGYLHAKGMFLRLQNGECVFVSGSANPSRPAWLANEKEGNTELMVARLGASAERVASELGFTEIPNLPPLLDSEWRSIAQNQLPHVGATTSRSNVGTAVVVDDEIQIDAVLAERLQNSTTLLLDANRQEIARGHGLTMKDEVYVAAFTREQLSQACFLRCVLDEQTTVNLLLHHARVIEEQARTGVQKQFKAALLSLQTDAPNIELLVECLDKIVFSDAALLSPPSSGSASPTQPTTSGEDSKPISLAIDLDEVGQRKSRGRLRHNSDLGYLLDTLIFHLRLQQDQSMSAVDRLGRSEEEQVGADDGESADQTHFSEFKQIQLLEICRTKVHTVVTRMVKRLRAYSEGKQTLDTVLFRLLGVLAVIRELRRCDGRTQWVPQGQTTVPSAERRYLLQEVMLSLFEGEVSLLHLESLGDELATSEDVARLKGLLLWLAWDCGLRFDPVRPFMETPEREAIRLDTNAMLLALVQSINADEQVTEEAQQSIGVFSSGSVEWIDAMRGVANLCDAAKRQALTLPTVEEAEPGIVAIHQSIRNWDLRLVAGARGKAISLINLSRVKPRIEYMPEHLLFTRIYTN